MKNLLLCNLLFCYIILASTSCNITNKLFHKNKTVIDSTSVVHEVKDSSAEKDSVIVRKNSVESKDEIVIEIDTAIRKSQINPSDYFEITPSGIKTNMPLKKVTIKGSNKAFNYDSLAGHSRIDESELRQAETHVTKSQKEVTKEVHKKRTWLWWLLLLIPIYLIYRNRGKIKAFILTILPL